MRELFEDKDLVFNLFAMSCIWSICSFSFYLGKFQLKHVAGDVFRNSFFSSIADTLAKPVGFYLYRKLQAKRALSFLFTLSLIGSIPVIFSETASQGYNDYVVPACLFVMNFGTSAIFGNLYIGHMDLFPVVFSNTSMGICNILARLCTVFAPIVAEIDEPTPEIIFSILVATAIIITLFIRNKTDKYY